MVATGTSLWCRFGGKRIKALIRSYHLRYIPQPGTAMIWPGIPWAAGATRKSTVSAISFRLAHFVRSLGFIVAMLDFSAEIGLNKN